MARYYPSSVRSIVHDGPDMPELQSRFLAALPRFRQQPLLIGKEQLDDSKVISFIRDWLFGGVYVTFEYRVQNLLTYMDAAARGDDALMLQIQQRMAKEG